MKKIFVEGNTLREVEVDDDKKYEDTGVYDADHPYTKEECINGVVYAMATGTFQHGIILGNIFAAIKKELKGKQCRVFPGTLEYHYSYDAGDEVRERDYLEPDVMVCCDKTKLIRHGYYAAPKFIAEVLGPGTAKYDMTIKFGIYERTGVSEYWLVDPSGSLDIYYLEDGHYNLHMSTMLTLDPLDRDYNADDTIALRDLPDVKMTLREIFE